MKEIFADYLVGERHCDALDSDDAQDMAIGSRQTRKEDDARVQMLRKVARAELRQIAGQWSDLRCEGGTVSQVCVDRIRLVELSGRRDQEEGAEMSGSPQRSPDQS